MKNVRVTEDAIRKVGGKEAFKSIEVAKKVADTGFVVKLKNGLKLIIEKGTLVLF